MSAALHRTTKEYLTRGASPVSHPVGDWIHNPDMSAVVGFGSQYWTITGDVVTLQSPAERAATDAALLAELIDSEKTRAKEPIAEDNDADGMRMRALIELLNKRDNYLVNRIIELQDRVQAMLDSTGPVGSMRTDGLAVSISATNTRDRPTAIADYRGIIDGDEVNAGE